MDTFGTLFHLSAVNDALPAYGLVLGLAAACSGVAAQVLPLTGPPTFTPGQRWVWRNVDQLTGRETERFESVFVAVQNDRLVFRNRDLPSGEATTVIQTLDQRSCRSLQSKDEMVCGGPMRLPIPAVGERWSYAKLRWRNGKGYTDADCQAAAEETVNTPAGAFPALRIERKGWWSRVFDGSGSGRYEETYWWSPAVKRPVKIEAVMRRGNGTTGNHVLTELVEAPAP